MINELTLYDMRGLFVKQNECSIPQAHASRNQHSSLWGIHGARHSLHHSALAPWIEKGSRDHLSRHLGQSYFGQ